MPEPKAPARKGGRNIPTYYYAIGAAGIAAAYFLYSRNKAKAAAAAATTPVAPTDNSGTAATPTAASAAGDQAVTQADLVSLLNSLQPVSTAEGTGADADETHPIIEIVDPKTGKKTQVKTKPRPRAHANTQEVTTPTVDTTPDVVPSVKSATPAKRQGPAINAEGGVGNTPEGPAIPKQKPKRRTVNIGATNVGRGTPVR